MKSVVVVLRALILAFSAAVSASCASGSLPPPDFAFDPSSPRALLVATGQLRQVRWTYSEYSFRQVDLESGRFLGAPFSVGFAHAKSRNGDELRALIGDRDISRVLFAVRLVSPGDYALVGQVEQTSGTPYYETVSVCYADEAPVFRLEAGGISIVDAYRGSLIPHRRALEPTSLPHDQIVTDFAWVRAYYPNLVGDASIVPPVATIRWAGGSPTHCALAEELTFEIGGVGTP